MERLTTEDYELIGCHGCEEKGVCYARYWCSKKKKALIELKRYEDTGLTPEQIQELKERDTAKPPIDIEDNYGFFVCQSCGNSIYASDDFESHKFCLNCGQRIKWEDRT